MTQLTAIIGVFAMIYLAYPRSQKVQVIDLPEEYKELSHNSAKPDTVLAFYNNDTVFIQFKSK